MCPFFLQEKSLHETPSAEKIQPRKPKRHDPKEILQAAIPPLSLLAMKETPDVDPTTILGETELEEGNNSSTNRSDSIAPW